MYGFPSRFGVYNQAFTQAFTPPYATTITPYAQPANYIQPAPIVAMPNTPINNPYGVANNYTQGIPNGYGSALQDGNAVPIQSSLWGQPASGSYARGIANGVDSQALALSSRDYQLALAIARSKDALAWSLAANTPNGTTSNSFALTPQGFFVNGQPYQGQNLGYDPFALLQGSF